MTKVQRSALAVSVFGSFIAPFMISSVNVALPAIQKGFAGGEVSVVLLSWVAMIYLLAAGVSLVPMGRLADITGRKKLLAYGFALFSFGGFFCFFSPSVYFLIFFRGLQGLGGGMVFSTGMAILTSVFPPNRRGRVLGIAVSAVYVGLSTGPFAGGMLTHYFGWRSLFLVVSLLGMIPLVLTMMLEGEWADAKGEEYDGIGALIYIPSLVGIIYGFSILPKLGGILALVLGSVGLAIFVRRQRKIDQPLFQVNLFVENRVFAFSSLAALIHYSATFGLTFLLSLYLQYIKGMDPRTAGTVLMAQPVMMAVVSPLAGRMSDRAEPRILSSIGMAITGGGLFCFVFLGFNTPVHLVVGILTILGFGFALFSSPNMNAIMGSVERRYLGIASGSAGTMRVFGQMFSMGIATLVLSLFVGGQAISSENYPQFLSSVKVCFLIFSILCLFGVFISLARGALHK